MVAAAPRIGAVLPAFLEFARGAVLVAHNAPFDLGFLKAACAENGWPGRRPPRSTPPSWPAGCSPATRCPTASWPPSRRTSPPPPQPCHRALDDARATVDVLHGLFERLGPLGITSLEELTGLTRQVDPERLRKRHLADDVPHGPGVYLFRGPRDEPLYVGTSNDLRSRVRSYFSAGEQRSRITEMVALAQRVDAIPCAHDLEAAVRELRLIAEHKPRYNRRSRFPERALWVRLTEEPFPRLSVVRRVRPGAGVFLGPFPDRRAADAAVAAVHESLPLRQCTTRLSPRVPAPPARWPAWAAAARRAPARSPSRSTPRSPRSSGPPSPPTRARWSRRCWPGSTGWPPRSGTRTPPCSATGSPSSCARCAAGSGWSRWPPSRSWCWPGRTATAAGSCPSSAGAGWWPPATRRGARRCAAPPDLLATAETPTGPDDELAASVDETELVLRWMEKPGTRLVELTGTLACPAPGTGPTAASSPGWRPAAPARPVRRRPVAGHPAPGPSG
jgi:DNA polymerase-3 subunit epsilon